MVFRLVLDTVRRKWRPAAIAVFQLHIMVHVLGRIWPSSEGVAWTMSGAWFLAIVSGDLLSSRELYQLPVSRRTWWVTRWWLCVLGPVVIAQLAVSLAQWRAGSPWFGVESAALYMTFGVLYCGCSLSLQTKAIWKWADEPYTTFMSSVAVLPAMIVFIAAPFLFAPYLPHAFAGLHATAIIVMLAMAAFTVVGYRHHPPIGPRPDMRIARRLPPVPGSSTPAREQPREGFIDRLTGAKMVLWEECRKQFIIFATVVGMGIAYWAIGSQFRPWPALEVVLRAFSLLPFTSPRALITEPIVFGALLVIPAFAEGWMATGMRSLRTLPISSTRLSSLPVGLGLVSASMGWIVLLVLHLLVLGTLPASLRPDLFIACAALTAAAQTIRFAAPGQAVTRQMLSLAPICVIWLGSAYFLDSSRGSWPTDAVQIGMFLGGLLTMAASWVVMHYAVTRASAMYRPQSAAVSR